MAGDAPLESPVAAKHPLIVCVLPVPDNYNQHQAVAAEGEAIERQQLSEDSPRGVGTVHSAPGGTRKVVQNQ